MAPDTTKGSLKLVNSSGILLTEDAQLPGMHVIEATGAQTKYFYIPTDGPANKTIENIRYMVDDAVTLAVTLEIKALGSANWKPLVNLSSGTLAADGTSQNINSKSGLNEHITSSTEARIAATVSGAANIGAQVITA